MEEIQDGGYTYGGIQTYRGASKHEGRHPNIWVVSKHMWASKHTGGVQTYRGIQMYGWCPNIWGNPNIWVVSKHGEHPNIQGVSKHMAAFKHTGGASEHTVCIHTYGGIQMNGGIWTPP